MKRINVFMIGLLVPMVFFCNKPEQEQTPHEIWYAQPAYRWMEALPVGNGRLWAMVFGDPQNEGIQLNEDSMWPGGPDWEYSKGNAGDLKHFRKLLREGKAHEVDASYIDKFSYKTVVRSHHIIGDLLSTLREK
ncbi:MAG: glycoside hydrolase N-terminal domain-containing protein [Flavobacteriaceae bacterium]